MTRRAVPSVGERETHTRAQILVVDDDERNRRLVRGWLEAEHELSEAADGPSALEVLDRAPIDLVLLDVAMPGMNGFDVCRAIRQRRADGPFLPVILLTALGEREDRIEGLRAGADDFLTKPCDRAELRLRVAAFLRTRRQDLVIRRQLEDLRHLSALKDDLVSLVVHDLRSPLSGAFSLLRLVRDGLHDPELRADLDAALSATERARATAEDLLEVRLLEDGALVAKRAACRADETIRAAIAPLEAAARARGISFEVTHEGDPVVPLDEDLLRRALENLLSNAVRYSPDGGVVTVASRRAGADLEIDVQDRGPGVPAAARATLFEKFGAVEARRGHGRRGYGLGLYLVKLVADAHAGSASLHDAPGGGALFRIRLPGAPVA